MNRYAQYGDVSPKIDVYAFGVVLFELISAMEAVVRTNEYVSESRGLVALVVFSSLPLSTIKPHNWHSIHKNSITDEMNVLNVMQFETVLSQPDPREDLGKLVDPRLSSDDYSLDSVYKVSFH